MFPSLFILDIDIYCLNPLLKHLYCGCKKFKSCSTLAVVKLCYDCQSALLSFDYGALRAI